MAFLAVWALLGLVLLAPLVLLHLHQRAPEVRDVASLLLWHEFALEAPGSRRRLRPPPLSLALALQALALILLVLALAEPVRSRVPSRPGTVVVLDDSDWLSATGALASSRRLAAAELAQLPAGAPVRVVLAAGTPAVIYRGSAAGARAAIMRVQAGAAPSTLGAALVIAAGLLRGPRDRIVLVHAAADAVPALRANPGEVRILNAGGPSDDRAITSASARCGIGSPLTCEVLARIANTANAPTTVRVDAQVTDEPPAALSVTVGAHASTPVRLLTAPGVDVHLTLVGRDALAIDDSAWVAVPGDDDIPRSAAVTIVGRPAQARTLAQAFAAVPGVRLTLETPARYSPAVARRSDLVVLDAALPGGRLPPAPAVMLVDPSRLGGARPGAPQPDSTVSGSDPQSPLLSGVDLGALTIARDGARRLELPRWLAPVLWSPSGPLLAAGDDGRQRLSLISFQPPSSNLAQLPAMPLLAANIVRWSLAWLPASAAAGTTVGLDALPGARLATLRSGPRLLERIPLHGAATALSLPAPGLDTLTETGPGVSHSATIAVNAAPTSAPSGAVIDLRDRSLTAARPTPTPLAPWLLGAAALVLALELIVWMRARMPVIAR